MNKTRLVIAGGGTAGWLAAYAIIKRLGKVVDVTLVESDQIGTVGVGEATIPTMKTFHKMLEIDEREFMQATQATFKLGIYFDNWGKVDDSYIHSFGVIGQGTWMTEFHTYWMEAVKQGYKGDLGDFCLELRAAEAGKFSLMANNTPVNYAYHLNATAYAGYLRQKSEALGATRCEGIIQQVALDPDNGHIRAIHLDSGQVIEGDIFVDCTGFRGLLIGETLGVAYDDWSHWLAANSAQAVQTESTVAPPPFTRAIAHPIGWQWRIPLQTRTGNGIVYSSQFASDDEARQTLVDHLQGPMITEPRQIRFTTGKRRECWHKNCVAIGLSSGFLEPLESTSIHLITTSIMRLMRLMPFDGNMALAAERYNMDTKVELEAIRDFIILHYKQTARNDSPMWDFYREMDAPDSLRHRMDIFAANGYVTADNVNLFRVDSWLQVMMGQGIVPGHHHSGAALLPPQQLLQQMHAIRDKVKGNLAAMPSHADFLAQYCPAPM